MSFRLAGITLGLLFPLLTHALPAPVTGIGAEYKDGQVHVRWNPVEGDDISLYRIFYARRSILETGGQYDDFESVGGKLSGYIIKNPPVTDVLYVTLSAVNTGSEESDSFTEEVRIDISNGDTVGTVDPSQGMAPSPSRREREASTQGLLSVEQPSATELVLQFSQPVRIDRTRAKDAFRIEDAAGKALELTRLVIEDRTVRILTKPQEAGMIYRVSVSAVVTGSPAEGVTLPLDEGRSTKEFIAGAPAVTDAPVIEPDHPAAADTSADTVDNVRFIAEPARDGTWSVTVSWDSAGRDDVTGYILRAERENRETVVPYGRTSMLFTGVAPGTFTVSIRIQTTEGILEGVTHSITLGTPVVNSRLSNSGAGATLLLAASGALAGLRFYRRRSAGEQNGIVG